MKPSNSLDDILQHMEPSLLEGYKMFMYEVIIQGICYHNLNVDTLNRYLFDLNKEVMNELCAKALSYYEMHAPPKIKSFGI